MRQRGAYIFLIYRYRITFFKVGSIRDFNFVRLFFEREKVVLVSDGDNRGCGYYGWCAGRPATGYEAVSVDR